MTTFAEIAPSKSAKVQAIFSAIAKRYDLANHLLSGGLDFSWRHYAAELVSSWEPRRILDVATGSGDLAKVLKSQCPQSLVFGADFCQPMLQTARQKGLANLVAADALQMPFEDGTFDALTVAFGLRNMESWPGALAEMGRVLRPGGHVLVLDFSIPSPPLRWIYRPYLHYVLPLIAAAVTGQRAVYQYLADSIEEFPSGEAMEAILRSSGLEPCITERLQGGIVTIHTAQIAER